MKTLTCEVPDEVFEACREMAARRRRSVEQVAVQWLAEQAAAQQVAARKQCPSPARRRFRRFFGAVDSGDPHSGDNDRIDADLAREYAATHEEE